MPASRSRRRPAGQRAAPRGRSAGRISAGPAPAAGPVRRVGPADRPARPRPSTTRAGRALRLSGMLTALDGLAAAVYGGWLLVALVIRPRGTAVGVGIFGGLLLVVFGAGIAIAGRSLTRGRRRGRAPALVTHVVLLFIVPGLLAGGSWWLALPIAVVSVGALVGLFLPSSVRHLAGAAAGRPGRPAAAAPTADRAAVSRSARPAARARRR